MEMGPPSAGHFKSVVFADFNGDKIPDLAAGDVQNNRILVWYGGPGVTWSRPIALRVEGEVRDLVAIDLDLDGISDLAYTLRGTPGGVYTWMSVPKKRGKWQAGPAAAVEGLYEGLSVADIDGDGRWDLAAANATTEHNGGVQIFRGDGRGGWADLEVGPTRGGLYRDVQLVDVNGDGRVDVVAAGWGPESGLRVWLQREKGGWKGLPRIAEGNFWGAWAADLNRDGRIDLVASTFQNGVRVFLGMGDGRFEPGVSPVETGSFWKVRAADMNSDGIPDLIATSIDGQGIRLWLNDGRGRWEEDTRYLPQFGVFYGLWVRDIDGDGKLDVTVASRNDGVKVWLRGPVSPYADSGMPKGLARAAAVAQRTRTLGGGTRVMEVVEPKGEKLQPVRLGRHLLYPPEAINQTDPGEPTGGGSPGAVPASSPPGGVPSAASSAPTAARLNAAVEPAPSNGRTAQAGKSGSAAAERGQVPSNGRKTWEPPGSPEPYRIGNGDILQIAIWRGLEADLHRVIVDEEGKIGLTFLEDVQAAGLTVNQLDDSLSNLLKRFIKTPRLDVRVLEYRSQFFAMLGEVNRPAKYPITGPTRVFDAAILAGGATRAADLKNVKLLREGKTIAVDLEAIFLGDQTTNYLLREGDQLLVPQLDVRRGAIRVVGQVPNQGSFPLREDLRVLDAVLAAGCCRRVSAGDPLPDTRRTRVIREGKVIPIDLDEIILRGNQKQNILLKDGDQVIVPGEPRGAMTVVGEIGRPGRYNIEGRTQMLDVILLAGGHRPNADLTKVKVFRGGQAIRVNLAQVLFQGKQEENLELQDGDQVVVPALPIEQQARTAVSRRVYALGEVKNPGVYTFDATLANLSLLDVLTRAGGFTKFAVGSSTKVIRGDIERPLILASDVDRLLERGDITQNIPLKDQDIVFVPRSFIGDANDWMDKIRPFLTFFLFPASYRDQYATSSEALRVDIGGKGAEAATAVQPTVELNK